MKALDLHQRVLDAEYRAARPVRCVVLALTFLMLVSWTLGAVQRVPDRVTAVVALGWWIWITTSRKLLATRPT